MQIFKTHKPLFLLFGIYAICELFVMPFGNFPLNDDWTYGKSVLHLFTQGSYDIGLSAASLLTHLLWGTLFVKIFGFSFDVLRLSTLVSSVIFLIILYKLVIKLSGNKSVAFISCLCILFNPIYFNLSNTFMTDVNFLTLLAASVWFGIKFFEERRLLDFLMFFLLCIPLTLLRQFGLVIPAAFAVTSLFLRENKLKWFLASVAGSALVFSALAGYEAFLRSVPSSQVCYHFVGEASAPDRQGMITRIAESVKQRHLFILAHALVYPAPVIILFFIPVIKATRWLHVFVSLIIAGVTSYLMFRNVVFPMGNIFGNMHVGAETFYENQVPDAGRIGYTFSAGFASVMWWIQITLVGLVLMTFLLSLTRLKYLRLPPALIFTGACLFFYIGGLLVFEGHFDRYHLPTIMLVILIVAVVARGCEMQPVLSTFVILLSMYAAVAGTRDYFELHKKKWEAYHSLKTKEHAYRDGINGGLEITCWHEGTPYPFYDYLFIQNHKYLIQHNPEPGFRLLRSYRFKRCFPVKNDSLSIYVRDEITSTDVR